MSLYVVLKSRSCLGKQNGLERHIPFKGQFPKLVNEEIDFIQVDGDELDFILNTFSGIPHCLNRVQKWYGEIAKYIYENLRLL